MSRAVNEREVEGTDEEFLFHLSRGSTLLSKGENESARVSLERACELRPRDAKVLGLLGQTYYRLGLFEQAAEIYNKVVDENPAEAATRVNLGLANLKAKRYADAIKQLHIALDLQPGHKKAMGYLGLAMLDTGDPVKAREWFLKAGSEVGVARCNEILAGNASRPAPLAPAEETLEPAREERPAEPEPVAVAAQRADRAERPSLGPSPTLMSFAEAHQYSPAYELPFVVDGKTLVIGVHGALLCRVEGLFAARGALEMAPVMKQFRGRPTDTPFGEGRRRVHRVSGEGMLLLATDDRCFTALDLGAEAGYFQEDSIFAFEESVAFENGRVPASSAPDLNLVHLRGHGRFLLETRGEPMALEVTAQEPLRVPLESLIGWVGGLTPRVIALGEPQPAGQAGTVLVELSGDGRALVDPTIASEQKVRVQ